MEKINTTIIFITALLIFTIPGYAQHTLNIGDFWVYSQEYTIEKFSIIDTSTFFDSLLYYERDGTSILVSPFTQENTSSNEIIHSFTRRKLNGFFESLVIYQNPTDTVVFEEKTYKYNAQLGEKWIYDIFYFQDSTIVDTIWAEVEDVFQGYQFGEWRTIKKIHYYSNNPQVLLDFYKYFCDDFGELSEEHYFGFVSWLRGCYIDGVSYGDTSFAVLGISPGFSPTEFNLSQNYPNPFNPTTFIQYSISKRSHVKLIVYDIKGAEVVVLMDEIQAMGTYEVKFEPLKFNLSSGIYFYSLLSDDFIQTKKMVYLR